MEVKPSWFNVVGALPGKSKTGQVVIFSAHYDHVGTGKTNPYPTAGRKAKVKQEDDIYNGANDNASGVSAVITLAKYFKAIDRQERTLVFVAFTGEELGLVGSQYLAENCLPDSIVAVINIEMIGRSDSKYRRPYITGNEKSDLISILNHNYRNSGIKNA
jgi:Zn-dependent M28 family amino/carboxypeptidase